jgi:peptidyl-prolyl cis-trans isomerase SurA
MWGERVSALIVTCDSTADISKVYRKASKLASGRWDEDKLNDKFCASDTVRCITVEEIIVEKGENEKVDAIAEIPGQGSIYQEKGNSVFIVATGIIPPEPKALNETRGKVTSDYQDFLEQQWISELRRKYPVKVHEELLKKIDDQ